MHSESKYNHISNTDNTNTNNNINNINYQKRKNSELFKTLEKPEILFLSKTQNYVPIYNRFFSLNDSNYNNINLNHKWWLYNIKNSVDSNSDTKKIFQCRIKNIENDEIKNKNIFIKLAPLLDPFKYLVGKYSNIKDDKLYTLPNLDVNNNNNCHNKLLDANNSAYVDGFFVYLTSILKNNYKFNHGLEYYGSFLSVKNNFVINVFDDLDYLNNSDFFNKNKNILFKIDDYEHIFRSEKQKLKTIKIDYTSSAKSTLSVNSINNEIFENLFHENKSGNMNEFDEELVQVLDINAISINDDNKNNNDNDNDYNNRNNGNNDNKNDNNINTSTLKTSSSCSSRISYTNSETSENNEIDSEYKSASDWEDLNSDFDDKNSDEVDGDDNDSHDDSDDDDDDDGESIEEEINATISKFPVQLICMENCENTLDDLIINNKLSNDEWYSALMQIIMTLITYQKAFSFTHNDLHTNNIMYNETSSKFITYCYNKKIYKVPTFGKIFKIIDFGRSIYKFQGKLFCSDSFQNGNDAAGQYNTEPYFDEKKPRLEANFSFDLSRLACSIFDYLVEDLEEIKDFDKIEDPVKKLIVDWCLDDKGINLLYKNNGDERYPDFKLYKMIARHVHNHTPEAQLERPEFNKFIIENLSEFYTSRDKNQHNIKIDIDKIPVLV
uniref:Protein kinase domain-containing protein n=1 Tax=viral metagenome TaxID=1070528 RepID=A0A6C0JHE0_9ZZZZ